MGRWRRFALISAAAAATVALIACGSTEPPPAEKAEMPLEQARVERGRYIAENLALCEHCHSEIDWAAPGTPPVAGKAYAGALFPDEGVPFKVVVPNITPDIETGIGAWTDEELGRAIREGVSRDGRRLFPLMPYMNYRQMSDEDLASVIAYLRSVPPVRNALAKNEFPEPVKATFPPHQPITAPVPQPDASQHGAYLVTLASCVVCHTPMDKQFQPIMPLAFAGGFVMKGPWGEVASGNITPDASGISYYDEERFLQVMKTGDVGGRQLNVMMPSSYYRHLTDEDLKAMYAFIRTLPPVEHRVDNTEEAAPCERCGGRHGLGAGNRGED